MKYNNAMYEVERQTVEHYCGQHLNKQELDKLAEIRYHFNAIYDVKDLKRNNLSLSSYHLLVNVLNTIAEKKIACCCIEEVAAWCKNHGATVNNEGYNYIITL